MRPMCTATLRGLRLAVATLAVAATTLSVAGCATPCSENFYAVRPGMTKDEIEHLLGRPSSTWAGEGGSERWQWGDSLSSLATSKVFNDADTARVWAVWFDSDGLVSSYSEPDWARR